MRLRLALACLLLTLLLIVPAAALTKVHVPGCWYGEQRLDGTLACLVRDSHVHTSTFGPIPLPEGNDNVLGLRVSPLGEFLIAGQSHHGHGNVEWRAGAWRIVGPSYGLNSVLYDYQNRLHVGAPHFGSQGLRFAEHATGRIWTGDETYADHGRRIGEWTECNGVTVGQSGWSAAALVDGKRYTLERGSIVNIRMTCEGPNYAIYYHRQDDGSGFGLLLNRSEFSTFPEERDPTIPPPPPIEVCGDRVDNDGDGLVDEECPTEPEPQQFTYDVGPLNDYAQRRWAELPHETREQQAEALFRILYEFREQGHPEIEVYRKCPDNSPPCGTAFTGSDGQHYAEDIVVINLGGVKWWSDVGVSFGIPSARLDFTPHGFIGNGPTDQPHRCFAPPAPRGHTEPDPDPDPEPEPSPIDARVRQLEGQVLALQGLVATLQANVGDLAARVTLLEQRPSGGLTPEQLAQLDAVRQLLEALQAGLGTSRDLYHSHRLRWEPAR